MDESGYSMIQGEIKISRYFLVPLLVRCLGFSTQAGKREWNESNQNIIIPKI